MAALAGALAAAAVGVLTWPGRRPEPALPAFRPRFRPFRRARRTR
jgi:hypothetical protein